MNLPQASREDPNSIWPEFHYWGLYWGTTLIITKSYIIWCRHWQYRVGSITFILNSASWYKGHVMLREPEPVIYLFLIAPCCCVGCLPWLVPKFHALEDPITRLGSLITIIRCGQHDSTRTCRKSENLSLCVNCSCVPTDPMDLFFIFIWV